jgi:hypothetical protein
MQRDDEAAAAIIHGNAAGIATVTPRYLSHQGQA